MAARTSRPGATCGHIHPRRLQCGVGLVKHGEEPKKSKRPAPFGAIRPGYASLFCRRSLKGCLALSGGCRHQIRGAAECQE